MENGTCALDGAAARWLRMAELEYTTPLQYLASLIKRVQ